MLAKHRKVQVRGRNVGVVIIIKILIEKMLAYSLYNKSYIFLM